MDTKVLHWVDGLVGRYPALGKCREDIVKAYSLLEETYDAGGKLLICGNGGSASDAQHIVGELMKGFTKRRALSEGEKQALREADPVRGELLASRLQGSLPAIALGAGEAIVTAVANDNDPSLVFAQQVQGYGKSGDALLGITTSGNSENILCAAVAAKAKGLKVIALTGMGGGALATLSDVAIKVPEKETYKVQELHLPVYHCLCSMIEEHFWFDIC